MLVKFKTKNTGEPVIRIDSSEIYSVGNKIFEYNTLDVESWIVDDATLTYLQNAWAHEGMRRVRYKQNDVIEEGWFAGFIPPDINQPLCCYIENDIKMIKAIALIDVAFIPYEMEEKV